MCPIRQEGGLSTVAELVGQPSIMRTPERRTVQARNVRANLRSSARRFRGWQDDIPNSVVTGHD
jgi:hypothetical protein